MHKFRLHKEHPMKSVETYVRVGSDSIKNTNPRTLELWNKAISGDSYSDIIPLKEGNYLVDAHLYAELLEACAYNSDLDPYNIPNVNFTLINRSDNRWEEYKKQRLERGFDNSETWSLDSTIARFIEPRLKVFKETHGGYPSSLTEEKWDEILDKMIKAFEYINNEDLGIDKNEYGPKKYEKREQIIKEGLDLFREYFFALWW